MPTDELCCLIFDFVDLRTHLCLELFTPALALSITDRRQVHSEISQLFPGIVTALRRPRARAGCYFCISGGFSSSAVSSPLQSRPASPSRTSAGVH
ncbi:uncharacterized protein FIBRA_07739 [Fibroporia radiculosa]|uniref:Uncharacterized protein n=1 Tax=Fibroporia radiculosa TaxID=599839 RepID=J4H4S8_9APHY|nr:uncharacterized protein FIBRA_07739 [Fibroporia radiculosa]CCM05514.1 predicted protein [Fibroporia radiculosa]